jgi:hypothetical protein
MPRTHIKALTYAPKIPGVLSGKITQTIRPLPVSPVIYNRPTLEQREKMRRKQKLGTVRPGDSILFHGWEGKPYRSPWSWRLKVQVDAVYFTKIYKEGIARPQLSEMELNTPTARLGFLPWSACDNLAWADGIKGGKTMGEVFNSMYRLESYYGNAIDSKATKYFQIIRWSWPPVEG